MKARLFGRLLIYYLAKHPRKGFSIFRSAILNGISSRFYCCSTTSSTPTSLTIRVTNSCNLRCAQCGQWGENGVFLSSAKHSVGTDLTSENWADFFKKNRSKISHIYFWGGEPFLRKDFLATARYASELGIITEVNTNGTFLLNQEPQTLDAQIDYLWVSMDGPEEINNRIRRGPGNVHKQVMAGLRSLVELEQKRKSPVPIISICMTLTEENQNYIYETYELAKEVGVDIFHLQFGIFTSDSIAKTSSELFKDAFGNEPKYWEGFVRDTSKMDPARIAAQTAAIRKDVQKNNRIIFRQTPDFDFDISEYFSKPEKFLKTNQCSIPWKYFQILSNGDVAMCTDFPDHIVGNIMEDKLEAIWNSEKARHYRAVILQRGIFPACSRCCSYLVTRSKLKLLLASLLR